MSTSISSIQNGPVAGESSTNNESPFDLGPSILAATESLKTVVKQQATEYAQAERVRTDLALDNEFATKRSKRQKQFDAETESEERDRILAYLKPKLTKETYESVLSELGVSNATSLVDEKPSHIDLRSESSSDKVAGDDLSANKGEVQSSTLNGSSSEDILEGKTMVEEPLNETTSADSGKSGQEVAKPKDGNGDRASHKSLAATSMPGSPTSDVDAADDGSSALDKPNTCTSPRTPAANVAKIIQDSHAAPATPDNAAPNHGAADHDASSPLDTSFTSTSPDTPTTKASTANDSSPLDGPKFTKAAKDTNTSPPPEKPDSTESEHKAGFSKLASQAQASGLDSGPKFGASFSPSNAHIAGQNLPGFGSGQEFVSTTSSAFPWFAAAQRGSFGSGRDGGIVGGSSTVQDATFGKPDSNITAGGTKRNFGDVSRDDDNSDEPSHKRARTDGGSDPTTASGFPANIKDENSMGTSTPTRPTSFTPKYDSFMAAPKLDSSRFGSTTTATTAIPPAALSEPPSKPPHALFGSRTGLKVFNAGIIPSSNGQNVFNYKYTARGQDVSNKNTANGEYVLKNKNTSSGQDVSNKNTASGEDVLNNKKSSSGQDVSNKNTASGEDVLNNKNTSIGLDATNTEVLSNSQDAPDSEDRSKSKSTTDVEDSTDSDSLDNDEEEEIL